MFFKNDNYLSLYHQRLMWSDKERTRLPFCTHINTIKQFSQSTKAHTNAPFLKERKSMNYGSALRVHDPLRCTAGRIIYDLSPFHPFLWSTNKYLNYFMLEFTGKQKDRFHFLYENSICQRPLTPVRNWRLSRVLGPCGTMGGLTLSASLMFNLIGSSGSVASLDPLKKELLWQWMYNNFYFGLFFLLTPGRL